MTQKRLILVVGGALAALLVAILIVGALILARMNADTAQQNYEACMARYGFSADAPPDTGGDDRAWMDAIAAAGEKCDHLR